MKGRESIRPDDLAITIRKVEQDYLASIRQNRFWHRDGPLATHFINALQATFPEGERFFMAAARDGVKRLKHRGALDDQLERDYEAFLRQEGAHSVQHARWNDALVSVGYGYIETYDAQLRSLRRWIRRHFSISSRLGMTAAAEHYTATLAHLLVHGRKSLLPGMARPFQTLMLYHAMEEVEHKAVCYDLYQALSGSYVRRVATFLFITLDLWISVYLRNRYLLWMDGLRNSPEQRRGMRGFYWGREGLFRIIWPRVRAYLRPSFHPWQTDERVELEQRFGSLRRDLGIRAFG